MTTYEEVLSAVTTMPVAEKVRLLENISALLRHDLIESDPKPFQSLYGLFADLGAAPSMQDIDDARHEMWS